MRKSMLLTSVATFPAQLFLIIAPFGKFALSPRGIITPDGVKSWIFMELFAPFSLAYTLMKAPLLGPDITPFSGPQRVLSTLFLVHYANRAIISPLRTPSRSRSHISVIFCGVCFNVVNGLMMGTYLRSDLAHAFLYSAPKQPVFWIGLSLWFVGFCGNILHDEVLLNIRRKANAKGKSKDKGGSDKGPEYYAIPYGYLFEYLSYPNYLCEWVEWFGFALAASPVPSATSFSAFLQNAQAPWIFLIAEVCTMLPRAYRGHLWYHMKFPEYPRERRAIIPYIL